MVKMKPPKVKIYVEGGGDSESLRSELRRAMSKLLKKLDLKKMPAIIACGGRNQTFDRFQTAVREGKDQVFLLVDSEASVGQSHEFLPWEHLKQRDDWSSTDNMDDDQCHLMVQCMESWFLADPEALKVFFKQGFVEKHIPPQGQDVEAISKNQVLTKLENATRNSTKGAYRKGDHSFEILEKIAPEKIKAASKWAERFFNTLIEKCN